MKKVVKLLVCLLLTVFTLSAACAEGIVFAQQAVDHEALECYPSYTCDAETGKWTVQTYQADALVDRFWSYGISNNSRTCVFVLAAEGNRNTGVWTPVLRLYYIDGEAINARAVSILVDGERYDLAASSADARRGRHVAECVTVPLNEDGMAVVRLLQQAEKATVRLIGDETHTVEINRAATTERRILEAASLKGLDAGLALIDELGGCGLWDLSAQAWENEYGFAPAVTKGVVETRLSGKPVADVMGMILPENSSDAAVAVQSVLMEYGFLTGPADWMFDDNAVDATLRAQRYLDRVPTGCYDAGLELALAEGRKTAEKTAQPMEQLGDTAQISLNRYWFAQGVSASENAESLRSAANSDNLLLVADGEIRNLSADELHLFMQVEASVIYQDTYAYEAELVCECSNGTALDTLLLPLQQARLIVYAEVPAELAQDAQADWRIALTAGGETLEFELQ